MGTPDRATIARRLRRRLPAGGFSPEDERELIGIVAGLLYLTGAISAMALQALPGPRLSSSPAAIAIAVAGGAWGLFCLFGIRWRQAPWWLVHASTTAGFPITAGVMASTGGASSPARFYLFFIVVFAAYFFTRRTMLLYLIGCAITAAVPVAYSAHAVSAGFLRELVVVIPSYFVLGLTIGAGKLLMTHMRDAAQEAGAEARRLADEQGALRRVATAVARASSPEEVYGLVSKESAQLVSGDAAGLLRLESSELAVVVGSWGSGAGGTYEPGTEVPIRPHSDLEQLRDSYAPVRVDEHAEGSPVRLLGYRCSVIVPVLVGDRLWGSLAVVSSAAGGLPAEAEERIGTFCDLLATAIANTEQRAKLAEQAISDPLTGLVNHRSFHERLNVEVGRAARHGDPLSLAVVDIDHFKEANDSVGHEVGDRILVELALRLRTIARAEDVVARIGGDEFALILPQTNRMQALTAIERLRVDVSSETVEGRRITISAGICDLRDAEDAEALFRLADGALYWSKAHGRDTAWVYDPDVVHELSAQERADQLQRGQAMTGLRALAHAIDARDHTTRRHSERVAALAAALAETRGWSSERVVLLREAALIHDVGKIGIPDAILLKPGPLTDNEYEQVKLHASLSAQIAAEVLAEEQVDWVRAHHERPDGGGYPAGLHAAEISEGAGLLALADAWDVMTVSRPYSVPKSGAAALAECQTLVGLQFTEASVVALTELHRSGRLEELTSSSEHSRA